MSYRVFVRNWWREAGKGEAGWPNGLVPNSGDRGRTLGHAETEEEARAMCKAYNSTHKPGRLSKKAEYTSD